jgi:hypothetical protein
MKIIVVHQVEFWLFKHCKIIAHNARWYIIITRRYFTY